MVGVEFSRMEGNLVCNFLFHFSLFVCFLNVHSEGSVKEQLTFTGLSMTVLHLKSFLFQFFNPFFSFLATAIDSP